jgi:hypothetical protein
VVDVVSCKIHRRMPRVKPCQGLTRPSDNHRNPRSMNDEESVEWTKKESTVIVDRGISRVCTDSVMVSLRLRDRWVAVAGNLTNDHARVRLESRYLVGTT